MAPDMDFPRTGAAEYRFAAIRVIESGAIGPVLGAATTAAAVATGAIEGELAMVIGPALLRLDAVKGAAAAAGVIEGDLAMVIEAALLRLSAAKELRLDPPPVLLRRLLATAVLDVAERPPAATADPRTGSDLAHARRGAFPIAAILLGNPAALRR